MRNFNYAFSVITALFALNIFAQPAGYKDRLARVRDVVNSKELVMIWNQGPNQNDQSMYQRIFDLDLTHPGGVDSTLTRKPLQIDSAVAGNKKMAVASGNFLGGKLKNIVTAWSAPGDSIAVVIPHIQSGTQSWNAASRLMIPGLTSIGIHRKIHLVTGDFYDNRQDEFVLAFHGADSTIHLQLYSFNPGSLDPQPTSSINDEQLMLPGTTLDNWNIVSGDFDGDGYHDIALLFVKPLGGSDWALYAKIYSVDDAGNIVPKASQEIFHKPAYQVLDINIAGASGALDADAALEIAFGFSFFQGSEPGPDTYVYMLDVRNSLNTIFTSDTTRIERNVVSVNEMIPLDVETGDLNNDARDEVVLMVGQYFYIYSVGDQMQTQYMTQRGVNIEGDNAHSDDFLEIEDMDLDQKSEIVVAKSWPGSGSPGDMQHFDIHVFSIDSMLSTFTVKAQRLYELQIPANNGLRNYAIAMGDFDGDRVRLGAPVHYTKTGVMQPTVILNTPPIHYDIFDTTVVDLSGCYPGQSCGFSASYIQSTTVDTTITTEIHEDWGGDAQITSAALVIQARVKATYGDKFSFQETSSRSQTITIGRVAAGDDWIYANVYDIDFYEYPVYDSLDTVLGHFIVSIPGIPRPLWIESKNDHVLGNQFRPDHEVGNILSYSTENTFDTSRVIVDFPEQTIGSTGNSFVSLQISSFRENQVDSSWDAGLEVGILIDAMGDFSGFQAGVEVEVNGHYNYGEVFTQTVRVGNSMEVRSDFGHIQPQFGTSGSYYVGPYAYWTSYGALALDYKVSHLAGAGSFWQTMYGNKVDPAFSLPWRYDEEKGFQFPGNDPSYKNRSRDIVLSEVEPVGGDTVLIGARIRNLGLQDISPPITLRFYNGDPASGGILIEDVIMDSVIIARSSRLVTAEWVIPLAQPLTNARVYVEIDPDNVVSNEVHEDNNIGWAPVISLGNPNYIAHNPKAPSGFVLYHSYPNPFNPVTTIEYNLFQPEKVVLKIFNVLGQEVLTLLDQKQTAGNHKVRFDGKGLASGTYYYSLQAGEFQEVRKMVLLK